MPDDEKLSPADPQDLADAIAFALNFSCRKRVHDSDAFMAKIVADRIVRHLEQARYVIMKNADRGRRRQSGSNRDSRILRPEMPIIGGSDRYPNAYPDEILPNLRLR